MEEKTSTGDIELEEKTEDIIRANAKKLALEFKDQRKDFKTWSEIDEMKADKKLKILTRLNLELKPEFKNADLSEDKPENELKEYLKYPEGWEKLLQQEINMEDKDSLPHLTVMKEYKKHLSDHYTYDLVIVFGMTQSTDNVKIKRIKEHEKSDKPEWSTISMPAHEYFDSETMRIFILLKEVGLEIYPYYGMNKEKIYCLVGASEDRLKIEAARLDLDILLNPKVIIEEGCKKKFPLALKARANKEAADNGKHDASEPSLAFFKGIYGFFKLEDTGFNNTKINDKLYQRHHNITTLRHPDTIFSNINRLKLTRSIIETEQTFGGAGLNLAGYIEQENHPIEAFYPLDDPFPKQQLRSKLFKVFALCDQPVEELRDYFGEQIAMYFEFLSVYVYWLALPSVLGLALLIWQMVVRDFGIEGAPFFAFCMCIWSTAFLEHWKRKTSELRMKFGMAKFKRKETDRPEFDGIFKESPVTGEWEQVPNLRKTITRIILSNNVVLLFLCVIITTVIGLFVLRVEILTHIRGEALETTLPAIANAVAIMILNYFWGGIAVRLNKYENHKTDSEYENSLVAKSFTFKFINSYATLFYIGFLKRYESQLNFCKGSYVFFVNAINSQKWLNQFSPLPRNGTRKYIYAPQIFTNTPIWENWTCKPGAKSPISGEELKIEDVYGVCGAWNILQENGFAQNERRGWNYKGDCLEELGYQLIILFGVQLLINNAIELMPSLVGKCKGTPKEDQDVSKISSAERSLRLEHYPGAFEDFDELVVQFGYVVLFVVAYPVVPLLAFLNNWAENYVDGYKLLVLSRRPHPKGAYDIGTWYTVLNVVSYIAIMTNVLLVLMNHNRLLSFGDIDETITLRLGIFLITEHLLLTIKVAVSALVSDVPENVKLHFLREEKICHVLIGQ